MNIYIIFALLVPLTWAIMNIFDKYSQVHKSNNHLSFAVVAGLMNIALGIIISLFLDWSSVELIDLIAPALAGTMLGIQAYVYYLIIKKEDVSHFIGLMFIYPVFVAILSFLFFSEVISFIGYLGMALTLIGSLTISVRLNKIKLKVSAWMIAGVIATVIAYDLLVKKAVTSIPALNGMAISCIFLGIAILPALLNSSVRKGFKFEIKNWHWAIYSEGLTFIAIGLTYLAMKGLPVTIVSSLGATQPLILLVLERIADRWHGKMMRDHLLLPKLGSILFIVAGVVLLYIS